MQEASVVSVRNRGDRGSSNFSDRLLARLAATEYRLATSEAAREEIFRMRYDAYLAEGAIHSNADGRVHDRHDDASNTWIFGIHVDGVLVSSIRLSLATPAMREVPSMDVFSDVLGKVLDAGESFVDPTRFVANPGLDERVPELPYLTVRLAYMACRHFGATYGLASVRPEHRAFYRRMFGQSEWSPPRIFVPLLKPVCLMASRTEETRKHVLRRYPFMMPLDGECDAVFPDAARS